MLILCSFFVSANDVVFEFENEEVYPGQSLFIKLIFNVELYKDLSSSSVVIYDFEGNGVGSLKKELKKINDTLYYVSINKFPGIFDPGTYSFSLNNIDYKKDGEYFRESFSSPFVVKESDFKLYAWPSFFYRKFELIESPYFNVELKNLGTESVLISFDSHVGYVEVKWKPFNLGPSSSKIVRIDSNVYGVQKDYFEDDIIMLANVRFDMIVKRIKRKVKLKGLFLDIIAVLFFAEILVISAIFIHPFPIRSS